jgi:regulator of sigma E protease
VSLIPLGGYVKMLDEREAEVDAADRHQAFNTQSLSRRSAIVAAGPLVNLVFAVLLYSLLNWQVTPAAAPVLPVPVKGSQAEMGGVGLAASAYYALGHHWMHSNPFRLLMSFAGD